MLKGTSRAFRKCCSFRDLEVLNHSYWLSKSDEIERIFLLETRRSKKKTRPQYWVLRAAIESAGAQHGWFHADSMALSLYFSRIKWKVWKHFCIVELLDLERFSRRWLHCMTSQSLGRSRPASYTSNSVSGRPPIWSEIWSFLIKFSWLLISYFGEKWSGVKVIWVSNTQTPFQGRPKK